MVWCSGWELASAVSNAGGLGLIGAGSMRPNVLREHIVKTKQATKMPFGVNIPLLYPNVCNIIDIIIELQVPIVFTSAGNPKTWTAKLQAAGIKVVHVVSNVKFALKAEAAGVDALVAEGFEAGGHNGREETTTLTLIPEVRQVTALPLIAAGGIATGRQMLAAMVLGANGVQMGTRFIATTESSAHTQFKQAVVAATEGSTMLSLKKLVPVRLLKNTFYERVAKAEISGASADELSNILGQARAKRGMFEGDLLEGELEAGQVASLIKNIEPVANIIAKVVMEYTVAKEQLQHTKYNF